MSRGFTCLALMILGFFTFCLLYVDYKSLNLFGILLPTEGLYECFIYIFNFELIKAFSCNYLGILIFIILFVIFIGLILDFYNNNCNFFFYFYKTFDKNKYFILLILLLFFIVYNIK